MNYLQDYKWELVDQLLRAGLKNWESYRELSEWLEANQELIIEAEAQNVDIVEDEISGDIYIEFSYEVQIDGVIKAHEVRVYA